MNYPYENLENFTLRSFIDRSVNMYGDNSLVSYVGQKAISYKEFHSKMIEISSKIQELGIKKGDKVLLLSENMPHWSIAYFSVVYFGAVIVPVLPDFNPSDIHHIIRHSDAKGIFVSTKHLSTIEELEHSEVNFVINLESFEVVDELTNKSYLSTIKEKFSSKSADTSLHDDDLAAIVYTSGTTGHSKGVMLTHKNLTTNALSSHCIVKIEPEDVFLSILPLSHVFECTVGMLVPILHGSSVQYVDRTPTPSVLLKAFEITRPTFMLSVPLVIEKIYKTKVLSKFNSSLLTKNLYKIPFFRKKLNKIASKKLLKTFGGRMRFFALGGAGVPKYVEQFLYEGGFPYIVGYGLTETAPLLAGTPRDMTTKMQSTGPAMYGVELDIRDKNDFDSEGEIYARSPSVMLGYYKDPEKTKEILDDDGWFHTGDLGYIDDDGYLFISGRSKNMILGPSGENIYPEQIESIINEHELVVDSLVLQNEGKLIAKIHLDYEKIDEIFHGENEGSDEILKNIHHLLEEMRVDVNLRLASFSKILKFEEQPEPFIKTPTKKIKRYLYQN